MILNVFLSVFTLLSGCCGDSVKLKVLDKEIHVEAEKTIISFDLKVNNGSCCNFLLYNFNNETDLAFKEELFFCNGGIAAGATIFVYNEKMEVIHARIPPIPADIDYQPITAERVQQVIGEEKVRFRNSLQVIKTGESIVFSKRIDLKNFRLTPGTYYVKILYSAGDNTINMVTEDQIAEDMKKYKAKMFKGCVSSNLVKLIVE